MAYKWLAHIDNIASFRNGTLLFDIERHTARGLSPRGRIIHAKPRYAFMIDHVGAVEKGRIFRRPLSSRTFKLALDMHPDYVLDRETPVSIKYSSPSKNVFCNWEDCVSFGQARAGTMIGMIQSQPEESLKQVLESTLPAAIEDWNLLAKKLNLLPVSRSLYHRLVRQAKTANDRFPKHKRTAEWPKNPIRFLFEQE